MKKRQRKPCLRLLMLGIGTVLLCCLNVVSTQAAYPKKIYMLTGEKREITLGKYVDNTKYRWSSKNSKVALVSQKGKVTARKKGSTIISAKRGKKEIRIRVYIKNEVDLFMFAGQSNMSGGGNASLAPTVVPGYGYEYRSVTAPKALKPITEPFGKNENSGNLNDSGYKQGSLVSSFINSYFAKTKTPVVAISSSRIGASTYFWKNSLCEETKKRYQKASNYLKKRRIKIRHRYVVWFQGEAEGVYKVNGNTYLSNTEDIEQYFRKNCKTERFFMIRIGRYFGTEVENESDVNLFDEIIRTQTKLALNHPGFVLVSVKAASFPRSYYNEEGLHFNQYALNIIGKEAGENAAYYVQTKKQPDMYDEYLQTWIRGK